MAITDPGAIAFANEHLRPAADRLAQVYYTAKILNQTWGATSGDNASRFALYGPALKRFCDMVDRTYFHLTRSNHLWTALGMNALFTNSNSELVFDNADMTGQDLTRPPITGQDVQRLQARMAEWLAWLEKNAFDPASSNPLDYTNLRAILRMTSIGARTPTTNWAVTVINLTSALMTQYEATNPTYRAHILTVAVNVEPHFNLG